MTVSSSNISGCYKFLLIAAKYDVCRYEITRKNRSAPEFEAHYRGMHKTTDQLAKQQQRRAFWNALAATYLVNLAMKHMKVTPLICRRRGVLDVLLVTTMTWKQFTISVS